MLALRGFRARYGIFNYLAYLFVVHLACGLGQGYLPRYALCDLVRQGVVIENGPNGLFLIAFRLFDFVLLFGKAFGYDVFKLFHNRAHVYAGHYVVRELAVV